MRIVNSHLSDNYNPRHRVGDSLYILSSTCPRSLSSKANIIDEVAWTLAKERNHLLTRTGKTSRAASRSSNSRWSTLQGHAIHPPQTVRKVPLGSRWECCIIDSYHFSYLFWICDSQRVYPSVFVKKRSFRWIFMLYQGFYHVFNAFYWYRPP